MFWKDIEVKNNQFGKPYIVLHNNANKFIKLYKKNGIKIELSLSDEKEFAIANVVIFE